MIEIIAEGRVAAIHRQTKRKLTILLNLPATTGSEAPVITCTVTGELAVRLGNTIRIGQSLQVRGYITPPTTPIKIDSIMRLNR